MVGTTCTTDPSARWTIAESVVPPVSEPLDLDALKSQLFWCDGRPSERAGDALKALIAELQATRAERDRALSNHEDCDRLSRQAIAEQRGRAERAEAAITRVEAVLEEAVDPDVFWAVHAALRGDQ